MSMLMYKEITELIGRTPLVRLNRLSKPGSATIYGKVEFFNPGGSVKDRICLNMINEAERQGKLKPGGTIVEPTSGNTGIGLALISAVRGYKLILVMPESMSMERASLLSSYGAQLVLTPAWEGMKGSIREAESLFDGGLLAVAGQHPAGKRSEPGHDLRRAERARHAAAPSRASRSEAGGCE